MTQLKQTTMSHDTLKPKVAKVVHLSNEGTKKTSFKLWL